MKTMSAADFFEGEDTKRVLKAIHGLFETGEATIEADLVTADGQKIPYEFKARELKDHPNAAFAGIGRDISTRREAEKERDEVHDRMGDGFFAVDTDWRLTYINETGRDILGRAMGLDPETTTFEGIHLWDEIDDAETRTSYGKYHEAMETGESKSFETHSPAIDQHLNVRVFPSDTGLSVYFYDISEKHQQREEIKHREETLHEMHDIISTRESSFTEKVEALISLGRAELGTEYGSLAKIEGEDYNLQIVDSPGERFQAGDVVPLSTTNCERAATTEETVVLGDIKRDAPDLAQLPGYTDHGITCYIGAPVFVDSRVYGTFCFYDTDEREGQFSDWEVMLVDIMSQWVSYEIERENANETLQQQNRRLENFASIISHDLRNPLGVAMGSLDIAEETGDESHFERARNALSRMDTLIEDVLKLARSGQAIGELEDVDLGRISQECWHNIPQNGAALKTDSEGSIRADETRLKQLLENLLKNAVEHGGTDVTVHIGDLANGFYVEDTGSGIREDEYESIFEQGYSTTENGTGFGLAIVAEIAEAHGWDVDVGESQEGGLRFEFTGSM